MSLVEMVKAAHLLVDKHRALAAHFTDLGVARGTLPVFAIEHGLDAAALEDLRQTVAAQIEADPQLAGPTWSWSYLPLIVIATEVGYRYRGTGTDFWPRLSQELGADAGPGLRTGLTHLFERAHERFRLRAPGDSPWERHFPHISWPIGNALVPLEIQPQLADALKRAVRAGVAVDDTDRLLDYLKALAAGHTSRRFENWLHHGDVALEVMRRLLILDADGWLSEDVVRRIDLDLRKDWGALRAITEARRTIARRTARLAHIIPSRYALGLSDGVPSQLFVRGPALPAQLRSDVIATLSIHGDRIRAIGGAHAVSLRAFLAGGEIALGRAFPIPDSPLRRDDAYDVGDSAAGTTLERLQPLEPEFFAVDANAREAQAVFPDDILPSDTQVIQLIRVPEEGEPDTRVLDTSSPDDAAFLQHRGFEIAARIPQLRLLGLNAAWSENRFFGTFPVLVSQRGEAGAGLLLDGEVAAGNVVNIGGKEWTALDPASGPHVVEPAEGRGLDQLEFDVIEPADTEPAAVQITPTNATVADLESGRLEISISAPIALEAVPVRIRVVSTKGPSLSSEGVLERLPAKLTGRSPVFHEIQTELARLRASDAGVRLHVEVEGLLQATFKLPPIRREIFYDGDTGQWRRVGAESSALSSLSARVDSPLLGSEAGEPDATRLIVPDAPDHEALSAGLILSGRGARRIGLGGQHEVSLPPLLREPDSSGGHAGVIELSRAYAAWQLAQAHDPVGNWQRWTVSGALEAALVEQFCGAKWRELEAGIDLSVLAEHGALLRCAEPLGLVSGSDLPEIESRSDQDFLRERLLARLEEAVPDISEALFHWDDELAGDLDMAVIDAYEDLQKRLEANGVEAFEDVDMVRDAELWKRALERSREMPQLLMFRPFILPETRWSALLKPYYSDLSEDDLVDLLDAIHVDAHRRPGVRWLGRAEIRIMLQLWLSPKAMVETEGWQDLLAKGLSDVRTSRAVRYAALRRKLALQDLPDRSVH